ncbi:MAG: hypothetical protein V8Q30_10240 [Acutalibacteraceae bacterium]
MGETRHFQKEKRHLAMGQERTAPLETPEKPPALRVEMTGLAHKASGLSPAPFCSSVLSAVSQRNPAFGTDRGTRQIRLVLCRGFLPTKRPSKTGQERPEIGQGLFPYSVCESRIQANGAGFRQAVSLLWFLPVRLFPGDGPKFFLLSGGLFSEGK